MPGPIYAIGDIHGMHDLMAKAISEIEARHHSGVHIVFLGDYIDRGPKNKEVIETLMRGPTRSGDTWTVLRGNHEQMMVDACAGRSSMDWWLDNGGETTMKSFAGKIPDGVLKWCESLPLFFETPTHFFVHAGIRPGVALHFQDEETMLWVRRLFLEDERDHGKHIVHGHTPNRAAELLPNRTNLDSGAFFTKKLSAGRFDGSGGPSSVMEIML